MFTLNDLVSFCDYFGLTPKNLLPLVLMGGIFYWLISRKFEKFEQSVNEKFAKFERSVNERFEKFERSVDERFEATNQKFAIFEHTISARFQAIEHAVIEIQTFIANKYDIKLQHMITSEYGQSNSPMVLKDKYREFVTATGIDKQVSDQQNKLVKWLKSKHPATGLDAQDAITIFVVSGEIADYLDLTNFKNYLYEKGKTSDDAAGILTVYLFETLIPILQFPKGA